MSKKFNSIFFGLLIGLFMSFSLVFAVQDFTVTPTSISDALVESASGNTVLTIESTGNESVSLTITASNLVNGASTIPLVLGTSSITNLASGTSQNVQVSYTTGTVVGTYTGNVIVSNSANASQSITVPVTLQVTSSSGNALTFLEFGDDIYFEADREDGSFEETVVLENTGNETIENIRIRLTDLDANDDSIDRNDMEINGNDGDETYDVDDDDRTTVLQPGDQYDFDLYFSLSSNMDVDDYRGEIEITYTVGSVTHEEVFGLTVDVYSTNEDVVIEKNTLNVRNGEMELFLEAGESYDDIEFTITNDAGYDIDDLTFEIEDEFEGDVTSNSMSASIVEFSPSTVSLRKDRDRDIDMIVTIPDGQPTGEYSADLNLLNSNGDELDSIKVKIKVVGDIFVSNIGFNDNVNPGDNLDVAVTVNNQGTKLYRNIKISATIFDIDSGNSDLNEVSSSFLLDSDDSEVKNIRFNIPEDASDGSHVLEIRVTYGDEELVEVEEVIVQRPTHMVEITSASINPGVAKCDDVLYTYMKVQNLGKYDEDIVITSEVTGTNVKESTSSIDMDVDDRIQKNLVLDISDLEPGTYKVVQTVSYSGLVQKKESILRIDKCSETSGITIKPINETELNETGNETSTDSVTLFGAEMEKTTVYLASGIVFVFVLIVISLFFL